MIDSSDLPVLRGAGDAVHKLLLERLASCSKLSQEEREAIAEFAGDLAQKGLELQWLAARLLDVPESETPVLGALLGHAHAVVSQLATWENEAETHVLPAADRLRSKVAVKVSR